MFPLVRHLGVADAVPCNTMLSGHGRQTGYCGASQPGIEVRPSNDGRLDSREITKECEPVHQLATLSVKSKRQRVSTQTSFDAPPTNIAKPQPLQAILRNIRAVFETLCTFARWEHPVAVEICISSTPRRGRRTSQRLRHRLTQSPSVSAEFQ